MNSKKTAIITGSGVGLGAYIATSLNKHGYNVVINYSKSKKDAEKLVNKLSKKGKTLITRGDVTKNSDVISIVKKTLHKFGNIDILVNNAGLHIDKTVLKMDQKSWLKVIDTNLTGTFNFSKAVLPTMKKQQFGRIINISSFVAFIGVTGASNYAASKAGVVGFTKSFAKEVAKYGITVNAIAPGYFDIGMFNDFDKQTKNKILKNIPAKRLGQPAEISELIQILISSSYLTGQIFTLDGGYSC